ncbi:MAG: VOC family protein [Actinomycetota bacterium]|nr:VOC family protein [Actinomycetota bacterium]
MTVGPAFDGALFKQVAIVVDDLDQAVRQWSDILSVGPWTAYRYDETILRDMLYRGAPCTFSIRHALAWHGDVQFELVQPLNGPSIFRDYYEAGMGAIHHLGKYVDDHDAAVTEVLNRGFEPLQSARGFGADGDGAFAYFRPPGIDVIIELISAPATRRTPEFTY